MTSSEQKNIALGFSEAIRNSLDICDQQTEELLKVQNNLLNRLQTLKSNISEVVEHEANDIEFQSYANKLETSRKKITKMSKTLDHLDTRLQILENRLYTQRRK